MQKREKIINFYRNLSEKELLHILKRNINTGLRVTKLASTLSPDSENVIERLDSFVKFSQENTKELKCIEDSGIIAALARKDL